MYLSVGGVLWVNMMYTQGTHRLPSPLANVSIKVLCTSSQCVVYSRYTILYLPVGSLYLSLGCVPWVQMIYSPGSHTTVLFPRVNAYVLYTLSQYTLGIYTIPGMLCPFWPMYLSVFIVLWVSMMYTRGAQTIPSPRTLISSSVLCSTHNAYPRYTYYTFLVSHWIFQCVVHSESIWYILQIQMLYHP